MFHAPAFAQAATDAGGASLISQLALPVLLFAIFWFLLIRPQQKRVKEHKKMVSEVKKGDDIVTGGGLIGRVTRVKDDELEVELATGVRARVVKNTLTAVTARGAPVAANDTKSDAKSDAKG